MSDHVKLISPSSPSLETAIEKTRSKLQLQGAPLDSFTTRNVVLG